ncbi:hypothetical protein SAY86_028797 [Trapa natans]|uniref:Uncharacterized protein n=1 Tax=Trapa natans TaxID=22666 RepID=A0AAN7REQ2_TRANT|nr:hypothetical protein SAY86_028797 [Trapa natans]
MATAFSPISVSTALSSISSSRLASARLPEFGGLRIKSASVTQPIQSVSRSSRRNRTAAGSIFCEAQNAAIQGMETSCAEFHSVCGRGNMKQSCFSLIQQQAPDLMPLRIVLLMEFSC